MNRIFDIVNVMINKNYKASKLNSNKFQFLIYDMHYVHFGLNQISIDIEPSKHFSNLVTIYMF